MRITKLEKKNDILLGELDKMIVSETVQNELNLIEADKYLLLDATKEDMYMFTNEEKRVLVSIDKKTKKEKIVNINNYRYMGITNKNNLSSKELRFIVSNL